MENCDHVIVREVTFESAGGRLRATLYDKSNVGVVLCPPHPLYGGNRKDVRLVRVAEELASHNISALCIDYGSYGRGKREVQNILDAILYFREKVHSLGLLGYSFGAVVASNAAARTELMGFVAMSVLKRVDDLDVNLDFDCPKLFVHGKYDDVAPYSEFEEIFAGARGRKEKLVLDTGHFYVENFPEAIDLASRRIREFFSDLFFR